MTTLLKDQAYENLLKMLQDGYFESGQIYSLKALAVQLEMSITPVRDALQRLCDEGRMDMLPSRGFCLHKMTREELLEHYHFASAVEGYCVYSLADAYQQGEKTQYVQRLEQLVDGMRDRLGPETPFPEYFAYDRGFHQTILESLEDAFFNNLQHSAMGFYNHPEVQQDREIPREVIYQCHARILEHIKNGDSNGAYRALLDHASQMMSEFESE